MARKTESGECILYSSRRLKQDVPPGPANFPCHFATSLKSLGNPKVLLIA